MTENGSVKNKSYWLEMWKFVMCDKKRFFYCGSCEECLYEHDLTIIESDINELEKLGFTNDHEEFELEITNMQDGFKLTDARDEF